MRAYFGLALLAIAAEAKDEGRCCNASWPTEDKCGKECLSWSNEDWCNESKKNCKTCGHWCPDDSVEGSTVLNVFEVIEGVLVGALETEGVTDLESCITDVNPLVTDLEAAVKDFEDGSFHKIAAGIDELGHFISQVATTMEDCEKVISGDDVTKLKSMGEAFLHPKKLLFDSMKHVLLNGVSIYDDIKTGDKDLEDGKYEDAGKMYGTIAAKVLWG